MSSREVELEVASLREQLDDWNYRYYVLDEPTVPDAEYDRAMRRLQDLEEAHPEFRSDDSPSQRVGGSALSEFSQVQHEVPMLSLDNAFDAEELSDFNRRVLDRLKQPDALIEYACEPKLDGIAVSLM